MGAGTGFVICAAPEIGTGDINQGGNAFGTTMIIGTNDVQNLRFETGGTSRMQVDTSGNVQIGSTFAGAGRLYVRGVGITDATFALAVDQSGGLPLLYVRNDGNIGIGNSTPTATLHTTGANAVAGTYSLKIDDSANSTMVSVQNDGAAYFRTSVGIGVAAFSQGLRMAASVPIYFGAGNTYMYSSGDSFNLNGEAHITFMVNGANNCIMDATQMGVGITTGLGARLHVKGTTTDNTASALKIVDSADAVLFSIRNDSRIAMPGIQTGDAGLAAGDLYVDTAANILANGDLVLARKA